MMPFCESHPHKLAMWQLTFRVDEERARALSCAGAASLRAEALRLTKDWAAPFRRMIEDTKEHDVTGYPVYDRDPHFT